MSSNTIFDLNSPINTNEAVNCFYCNKLEKLENIIERIGSKFLHLRYEEKDRLFNDIGYCFIGLASELRSIKNDLKK